MKRWMILCLVVLLIGCSKTVVFEKLVLEGEHIEEKADFVDLYVSLDYKGNIEQSLQVEDVKRSIGDYSMYRVALDYAYAYDYVLKKDDELLRLPSGYASDVYLIDTNDDGFDELLLIGDIGSGLRILLMTHFDSKTGEIKTQKFYNDNNGIVLDIEDGAIMAYHDYYDEQSSQVMGPLIISDTIEIEGWDNSIDKEN